MSRQANFVDPVWIEKYALGHEERYPWDLVVTFLMSNAPRGETTEARSVLEVGCGTGNNLWFAAREGFKVSGIEASPAAVEKAAARFKDDRLLGDLRVGSFCSLPFEDSSFDFVIDRAALVCVDENRQTQAIDEIHRCLKRGGKFLHNTYTTDHASIRGTEKNPNGMYGPVTKGSVAGSGELRFVNEQEVKRLFSGSWKINNLERRTWSDMLTNDLSWHSEWVVVVEKQ